MSGAVRIVGLGSPQGDDRAGWEALATLATGPLPPDVSLHTCTSPAAELCPLLQDARRVVLVDAVAGNAAGTILRGNRSALVRGHRALSSHGVALETLLDLAESCGLLPPELSWVGVCIDPAHAEGDALSPAVAAALPALARAALEEALR
jgi:hydrogenase maturation protease